MNRKLKIKVRLLRLIAQTRDDASVLSREEDMYNDVALVVRPSPGTSEVRDILTECDREGLVIKLPPDEGIVRFDITPQGRSWLIKQEQC